jgi:hypothetical protein
MYLVLKLKFSRLENRFLAINQAIADIIPTAAISLAKTLGATVMPKGMARNW